jgi:hypothetical protein
VPPDEPLELLIKGVLVSATLGICIGVFARTMYLLFDMLIKDWHKRNEEYWKIWDEDPVWMPPKEKRNYPFRGRRGREL